MAARIYKTGDVINGRELIKGDRRGKWDMKCITCGCVTSQFPCDSKNYNCRCSKWIENLPREQHYLYNVHHGVLQRCYNINNPLYHRYGGRGIGVHKRWEDRNDDPFRNFVEDIHRELGLRPNMNSSRNGDYKIGGYTKQYGLGRLNHDIGYQPGNIEWCTREDNAKEMNSRYVEVTSDGALDRFYVNLGWG